MNALGRLAERSVARRRSSNSCAARTVGNVAKPFGVSQPQLAHVQASFVIFSAAISLKLGNWLVPRRTSLRADTSLRRFAEVAFIAS